MIENYKWSDPRNAIGWAAACARLALPFYGGGRLADVVAAIEIAERYAAGEEIDTTDDAAADAAAYAAATSAAYAAADAAAAATAASAYAAYYTAAAAATAAATYAANAAACAAACAAAAARAGVSQEAIDQLQLSAIAVDLGLALGSDAYFAAIAALSIGNIDWAREIAADTADFCSSTP